MGRLQRHGIIIFGANGSGKTTLVFLCRRRLKHVLNVSTDGHMNCIHDWSELIELLQGVKL